MATVTDPPPAGTLAEPLPVVAPAVTVTSSVAPAQAGGIAPTVTDATLDDDRFWSTVNPVFVQRPVLAVAAPTVPPESERDAANATEAPTRAPPPVNAAALIQRTACWRRAVSVSVG